MIDAASFQAGGFSARYGGRNSSVVDLRIKEGSFDDLTFNGTYDVLGWEFNYDGPSYIADNTSILLSARHQDFRNILRWTGQKDLGDPSFTDILFKSTTKFGNNHKLSIIGIFSPEDFDRNIDHVYESENAFDTDLTRSSETKKGGWVQLESINREFKLLYFNRLLQTKNWAASLGKVLNEAVNGALPLKENATVISDFLISRGDESIYGIKFEYNHQFNSDLGFTSGFEFNQTDAKYETIQSIIDTVFTFDKNDFRPDPTKKFLVFTPAMVNSTLDDNALNAIIYTEVKGKLGNAFNYNIGGRYERTGFNKSENISPRISLSYLVSENIKLNLASGIYYQAPDFWLFALNNNNRLLKNEKSTHLIGGITSYLSDEYKVTVEGYYKDFTDLVVRPERTSSLRTNGGKGWAAGIDLSIVRRLVDNWYGQLSYSWSHSKRNDDLGEGWYNSDFNQPNVFNILMGYEFNESWAISVKWKYATGRPKDSYIVNSDVLNDPNRLRYSKEITGENSDRFDDFHTLNLRVDHRLQLGKFALVMFLDISNLYSRLNVNEERFIYRDGSIEKKGFQILPTFGLKVEF
ncbi:MAG: hypothetical protein IPJ75_05485 [Ignavibacteriales bacterium]|nr:hypothetical protein [Ignavibacteriales bacterium]